MATAAGLMAIAEILARKGEPLRQRLRSGLNLLADMPGIGDLVRRQHKYRRMTIPACAALIESVQRNGTLRGMVGVYREGRYYSSSYATYSIEPNAYPPLESSQHCRCAC